MDYYPESGAIHPYPLDGITDPDTPDILPDEPEIPDPQIESVSERLATPADIRQFTYFVESPLRPFRSPSALPAHDFYYH